MNRPIDKEKFSDKVKEKRIREPLFARAAAYPHIVWAALFIIAPLLFVCYYAFTDQSGNFTLSNIQALSQHTGTFILSVSYSLIATVICLIIGYPLAFVISKA